MAFYLKFVVLAVVISVSLPSEAQPVNKNLFPAKEHGRFGFINSNGEFVIPPTFDYVFGFSEGLAAVSVDSLWGFIDSLGQVVIPIVFREAFSFSSGLAQVRNSLDRTENAFIDKSGKVVFKANNITQNFSEGFAMTTIKKRVAYYNTKGQLQIFTNYPYGSSFSEGLAQVWTGKRTKYIDRNGKTVLKIKGIGHDRFSEGLAAVRIKERNVYINPSGEIEIDSLNENWACLGFSEGLAQVTIPGGDARSGFINRKGKIIVPIDKYMVCDFHEGLAAFKESGKWGFLDTKGVVAIAPIFDFVNYHGFDRGLCWAGKDNMRGYINHVGTFVWTMDDEYMYKPIDTALWRLDTLRVDRFIEPDQVVTTNSCHYFKSDSVRSLALWVNEKEIAPFADKYFGNKLYLINGTSDTVRIPVQDGRLKLLHQALNEHGEWKYVENFINSFCGNSYNDIYLFPSQYFAFAVPVYRGDLQTRLRVVLHLEGGKLIYSNEYDGSISKKQFLNVDLGR